MLETNIPWWDGASRRARWLVGVSGGADSVALLRLMTGAGFRNLVVCHLNHCLRGRAATEDARFVSRLARELGLPSEMGITDVRERMVQRGESLETAARYARHEFFAQCARVHRCRRLVLAHHADDQAETVLWNLLRGSHGLKGMSPEKRLMVGRIELQIHRPLLEVRHAELVRWLTDHGHAWREDESNGAPVAVRNRLRNEVLPLLAEISGRDPVAALVQAVKDSAEREDFENELLRASHLLDPQGRLHLPALRKLPVLLQRAALRGFLQENGVQGIERRLLEKAVALIDVANPAAVNLPGGRVLRRSGGRIRVDG